MPPPAKPSPPEWAGPVCAADREKVSKFTTGNRAAWAAHETQRSTNADPAEQYLISTDRYMIMLLADGGMVANLLPDDYDEVPF